MSQDVFQMKMDIIWKNALVKVFCNNKVQKNVLWSQDEPGCVSNEDGHHMEKCSAVMSIYHDIRIYGISKENNDSN